MYLRRHNKKSGGVTYETWTLVETVRTVRGPRQRIVATIGKLPGLDAEEKVGWEEIGRILNNKPRSTLSLFETDPEIPEWATVNLRGLQVERLRSFGDVYLGLVLWHRLGLSDFCCPVPVRGPQRIRAGHPEPLHHQNGDRAHKTKEPGGEEQKTGPAKGGAQDRPSP